jgi:gliding motility-associated-like protein
VIVKIYKLVILKPDHYFSRLLVIIILFVIPYLGISKHIIGGEINYTCLGNNRYAFKFTIYRDCADLTGANFDDPLTFTVYQGFRLVSFPSRDLEVSPSRVDNVIPPTYPCLVTPPELCIEVAEYNFELELPQSNQSYTIVYQRCCRNATITNITNPGTHGATYSVEITPEAQNLCNSSPAFKEFPPLVVCNDQLLSFDHSAVDKDGDQLTYSLCDPWLGGGNNLSNVTSFQGVAPQPDAPPPYNAVPFRAPYTMGNPMGGNPSLGIAPISGLLVVKPAILGQFVAGVCVEERRNGVLLSRIRRDFQINVADCKPTVVADIEATKKLGNKSFLISSCGKKTVPVTNKSSERRFIQNFLWTFDIGGSTQTFSEWSPNIAFPTIGSYNGRLFLNRGLPCSDSAEVQINIFPGLYSNFNFAYDTCVPGPVRFTDLSRTLSPTQTIIDWDWSFGNTQSSADRNPIYTYRSPGLFPVILKVTDNNGCEADTIKPLSYFPAPVLAQATATPSDGCTPLFVQLKNNSFPIDSTYDITWDLGDGTKSKKLDPSHIYVNPGVYSVDIKVKSPIGCFSERAYPNLINVRQSPEAFFTIDTPLVPRSNFNRTVVVTDGSKRATQWRYDFGGTGISTLSDPTYTFPDTGIYVIEQIVTAFNGCKDTFTRKIDVAPQFTFFLPNAFTPNGDNTNDGWRPASIPYGITNYSLTIWNRYGELFFESGDPTLAWNGKKMNTGDEAGQDVFVYLIKFDGPRSKSYTYKGFITLLR